MKTLTNTLFALLSVLVVNQVQAMETTEAIARNTASKYCNNPSLKKSGSDNSSLLRSANTDDATYYLFSDESNRFCIISGDGHKVLGYGDNYSEDLPPQLQELLDTYTAEPQSEAELRSEKVRENIPSFMNVVFGHRTPYNKYVPVRDGKPGPTGCVPTALAQILKYYEYPSKLNKDIHGYSHLSKSHPDSVYAIEGQKAEGRNYDWSLVLNHYTGDTTEALNKEVAKVMIDCGKSVEARYEQKATSATNDMFYYSLVNYFGYNSDSIKLVSRDSFYREEWLDIIHEELSKKRPIYMSATSYEHGGHAFICDGYEDGYLHINWGWDGSSNGYFDVDILDYDHNVSMSQTTPANGYSFFQQIIIGIEPGNGSKKVTLPEPSSYVIRAEEEKTLDVTTRLRADGSSFVMYVILDGKISGLTSDKYFSVGYLNADGRVELIQNDAFSKSNGGELSLETNKHFDSTYLGKTITLYVVESEIDPNSGISIWDVCDLVEPISVEIPEKLEKDNSIIKPTNIEKVGYYSNSTILLRASIQTEKPKDCMNNLALAIVMDGDTMMSEVNTDYITYSGSSMSIEKKFSLSDIDKEIKMIVLQTEDFDNSQPLDAKDWIVCDNFEPITFKLSDITIFSTEMVVDTIIHNYNGRMHMFDVVFSNPTDFEYYDEVYFCIDKYATGVMLSIPAKGTAEKHIEHEIPVSSNYYQGAFGVITENSTEQIIFDKDTTSHVYCQFRAENETQLTLVVYNATYNEYEGTYRLYANTDSISSQTISLESDKSAKLNFNNPVYESQTDYINLDYIKYVVYDKEDNQVGSVVPVNFYGTISQHLVEGDINLDIDLKMIDTQSTSTITLGVTSSLDNSSKYEKVKFKNTDESGLLKGTIKYSDYFKQKKPTYIGLCKTDGTFYAYMKLNWDGVPSHNNNILSESTLSITSTKDGLLISSDKNIPSLPIYSVNGILIKTISIESESAAFVKLENGIYVVGGHKVLVK